jgi:exonuclease VII small subunit
MADTESIKIPRTSNRWVSYVIIVAMTLVGLVTLASLTIATLLIIFSDRLPSSTAVLAMAGLVVLSVASLALLLTLLLVHRQAESTFEHITSIDQQTAILAEQSVVRTQAHTYVDHSAEEAEATREMLERIHEVLLLPEEERMKRFQRMIDREFSERLATARHFIHTSDFHRARQELASLVERFGQDDPRIEQTTNELEQAANQARSSDVARVKQRVEELIHEGRWEDAEHTALRLADKYPETEAPAKLVERIRRERQTFEQQNRQRLHDQIQQFVSDRKWQEALSAANQFLQTFSAGVDVQALQEQLPTLRANAEIQSRKRFENRIRHFIQNQQYWDALALARRIIADYPLSPQANALRNQLPKLEELAHKQMPPKESS